MPYIVKTVLLMSSLCFSCKCCADPRAVLAELYSILQYTGISTPVLQYRISKLPQLPERPRVRMASYDWQKRKLLCALMHALRINVIVGQENREE